MDVVIVVPEPGQEKRIGQELTAALAQIGLPYTALKWVTWPQTGYQVPIEVLPYFEISDETQPAPKRRGRPKRTVDSTDKVEEE